MKHWIAMLALLCASVSEAAPEWVRAQVVSVDAAAARVTLKHERIKSIDMDAMTMPFKVAKDVALGGIKPGDRVRFVVATRSDHLVITALERAP